MMNREAPNQESPSLLSNNINHNTTTATNTEESPRKPQGGSGGGGGFGSASDRLKRDEWSEGAVSSLLEAYETKWVLRNRAKLKGQDWEDVAKHVSSRGNSSKSPKTQTQCKNKIESMKKRYRSESATGGDSSSWPLYPRLDLLLRGSGLPQPVQQQQPPPPPPPAANPTSTLVAEEEPSFPPQKPPPPPQPHQNLPVENTAQNSHGSTGVKEDGMEVKLSDHMSDKNGIDTDSSTPALIYNDKRKLKDKIYTEKNRKRQRKENLEIVESIRCLAEVVVRMEQARMDMMKELERMRAEAEIKRGEMDLKRTEIIANTQLEIAKLFAGIGKEVDSSFRIGRI